MGYQNEGTKPYTEGGYGVWIVGKYNLTSKEKRNTRLERRKVVDAGDLKLLADTKRAT